MGYRALLFCPDEKTAQTVTLILNDLEFTVEACAEPFAAVKKLVGEHFDGVVEGMALCLQGSLLVRHAPAAIADAFCASRLGGEGGLEYGTLPAGSDFEAIIARSLPDVDR